jgi:hypothetical protein
MRVLISLFLLVVVSASVSGESAHKALSINEYYTISGFSGEGQALSSTQSDTLEQCANACDALSDCVGFMYCQFVNATDCQYKTCNLYGFDYLDGSITDWCDPLGDYCYYEVFEAITEQYEHPDTRSSEHTGVTATDYRSSEHTGTNVTDYRSAEHTGANATDYRSAEHTGADATDYRPVENQPHPSGSPSPAAPYDPRDQSTLDPDRDVRDQTIHDPDYDPREF